MIHETRAIELVPGDQLSNNGATIEQVVLCGHGQHVYLFARFEDGYTTSVTVPAGRIIPTWTPDGHSRGHIAFVPRATGGFWEYWARQGEIWRQDTHAPIMSDGYRIGRWYGVDREATRANLRAAEGKVLA